MANMSYNAAMKITKLDNRHKAKKQYGFNYSCKVKHREFPTLTTSLTTMFGEGDNMRWIYPNENCTWAYWGKESTFYFKDDTALTVMTLMAS